MWPALALPVMSEGGVRFLQHSLSRALSLGPAAEDMFSSWSGTSVMDPATLSNWVAHLMCVGPEGGLWLDQAPEDRHVRVGDAEFATALRLRWQLPCPVPGGEIPAWPCRCTSCLGAPDDATHHRALCCSAGGLGHARHTNLCMELLRKAQAAGCRGVKAGRHGTDAASEVTFRELRGGI